MKLIYLTKGYTTQVDDIDFEQLNRFKWYAATSRSNTPIYAARKSGTKPRKNIYMHRLLLNAPQDREVDHIDGNGLNNTRGNIRLVTRRQNSLNTSKRPSRIPYRGVEFRKADGRYWCRIVHNGKRISIGYFHSAVNAATAYDKKALELFGEFGKLNFPTPKAK